MRRNYSLFLFLVLILFTVASLSGCGGGSKTTSASDLNSTPATSEAKSLKAMVAEVETASALQVNADGTVSLKPMSDRSTKLSPEAEAFALQAISELNPLVKSGKVRVASDLSVTPIGLSPRLPRFVGWRWWGGVFRFSHNDIVGGVANTIARMTLGIKGKSLLITGPIWAALSYVDNSDGQQGAYLYVTWVLLWAAGPTSG